MRGDRIRFVAAFIVVLCFSACGLPKDPEETSSHVHGGTMRVGVMTSPPFARIENGEVSGTEAALLEAFARDIDAHVTWVEGSESALYAALERFDLDLVIGGVTEDTEWKTRIALTRPYVRTWVCGGALTAAHAADNDRASEIVVPLARRLQRTDDCSIEEAHVMAMSPGENAWLVEVDSFLQAHANDARRALASETSL